MKHFLNHIEDSEAIAIIISHAIDVSTIEMDFFRDACKRVETVRRMLGVSHETMERYLNDLRTDIKLSETPLKGEEKMRVMMVGSSYFTALERLYKKMGHAFNENDFACDADPARLAANLLKPVPSGCASSYMIIRSFINSVRSNVLNGYDGPGTLKLGYDRGR